jgi:hypothetical protein
MPQVMRNLALTFENSGPGEFLWIIREGELGSLTYSKEIDAAATPLATFEDAMRSGYDKLATMLYADRALGPQIEVTWCDAEESQVEKQEYGGKLIEIFVKRLAAGTFHPYLRLHAATDETSGWTSPRVPTPCGGFYERRDAIETALTIGEMAIDGHEYAGPCQLSEGGPSDT